ncbi:MAG: beta-ketoacyl synthase N-terminal-like domain-containing protein [Gemmatimonadales bacterium]
MTAEPVLVVGVGMITSVGLSAPETSASVRAGIMRFEEATLHDHVYQPFTLAEVPEYGLPDSPDDFGRLEASSREDRMLRLTECALGECLNLLPSRAASPGLIVALPETPTTRPVDEAALLEDLAQAVGGRVDLRRSNASPRGRAGGLAAIARAGDLIRAGQADLVVAGGIDTYRDSWVLARLDAERRVKSEVNLDGFIPGEGAAFLLLADRRAAGALGLAPMAAVSRVAEAFETGHLYSDEPYSGAGLAATLAQLFQSGAASAPIQEVYSSMNGESFWAKEWGVAFLRNRAAFHAAHRMHHPADCYGDIGAACGPLMVGLAAVGIRDGYRRSPALVYGSSDHGARAALIVSAAE